MGAALYACRKRLVLAFSRYMARRYLAAVDRERRRF